MSFDFNGENSSPNRVKIILISLILMIVIGGSAVVFAVWFIFRQSEPAVIAITPLPIATTTQIEGEKGFLPEGDPDIGVENGTNRIVFINPDGQVATINPEGENGRVLTRSDLVYQFPTWAPDGEFIATLGVDRTEAGIYLLEDKVLQDEPRELYLSRTQTPFYLYWAPDSQYVSFLANHPTERIGLRLVAVNGVTDSRLLTTGSPFYWDWTADGDQILIHTGLAGSDARLGLIDRFGKAVGPNLAQPGYFQAPGISSSGRYFAYAEEIVEGISQLIVEDIQTGDRHQERHVGLVALSWSPTSEELAIISAFRDVPQFIGPLRVYNAESGEAKLLSREAVLAFFWSPDGRYIAVLSSQGENDDINASFINYKSRQSTRLVKNNQTLSNFSGEPANLQQPSPHLLTLSIIEVSTGQRLKFVQFQPTLIFLNQLLPFFDQYALSHRIWAPDSSALVLPMNVDQENKVVIVSLNGDNIQPIASGDTPFWSQQ